MKKRRRIRIRRPMALLLIVIAALAALMLIRLRLFPLAEDLAVTKITNQTSNLINDAIDQQIRTGAVDYTNMVLLEKDGSGNVTALKTNIAEMNALKTKILDTVNQEIMQLDVEEISVPLGNLILPAFFSGRGPYLPVKVLSVRSSDASFENQFTQAGINQTLHQILMTVTIDMTVVTPAGTTLVETSSQVVVAETVIVGTVPNSYLSMNTDRTASS